MSENLIPNDGPGLKFASWTPTAIGAATSPLSTYGATSGADSMPGTVLSATGASGGVSLVSTVGIEGETCLALGVVCVASSATPTIVPFAVKYTDANGNTIVTHTPIASASAVAAATEYTAVSVVPDGAVHAVVTLAALSWASVGGYTVAVSSPVVAAL